MAHRKIRQLIPLLVLISGVFVSCSSGNKETTTESLPAVKVSVQKIAIQNLPNYYRFPGTIEGQYRINLSTKIMGRVSYLPFENGAKIKKGQTLIRIQSDNVRAQKEQVEANLAEAQAAFANVKTNYDRMKALFAEQSATQKELDDITTQYKMAQAKISMLQGKLKEINDVLGYAVIKAPFDGHIVNKMVQTGDMASPGMPLLTIEGGRILKVRASVPESQIDAFNNGDPVQIKVDAIGDETFGGVIESINPSGNPGSRQFEVIIRFTGKPNELKSVKSGMFANVVLEKGSQAVITVPKSSVVERGQLTGIYTISDNKEAMLRWVKTGRTIGQDVEILSGLKAGESFIASAGSRLQEGQKVIIQ